jgi:hypothetical protein
MLVMTKTAQTTLLEMITDVERLVTAGAESANGHERLSYHANRLENWSTQVPALKKLLPLIHRVLHAEKNQVASELLQLVIHTRHIRASIVEPNSLKGELESVPSSEDWQTDTPLVELVSEVGQIWRSGPYRTGISKKDLYTPSKDMRMVGRIISWLKSNNTRLVNSMIDEVIPAMGPRMAKELERDSFNPNQLGDMNRLIALSKIAPESGMKAISQIDPELTAYLQEDPLPDPIPEKKKKPKPQKKVKQKKELSVAAR